MRPGSDQYVPLLLAVCIVIFFSHLGTIYVNIMEARNFITAREMINSNHWLLTTLNDLPRYQKPPLPTWLTAISGKLFGLDALWALRLPASLCATLLTFFLFRLGSLIEITRKQAFLSSLILATSFYIIFSGRNGQWDIFTHAFMMVSIYCLFRFLSGNGRELKNAILAGVFLGFSIMSKGPVSLYALFLPFLLAFGFTYGFRNAKQKWLGGLLFLIIGLGVGLWWFIYVRWADPVSFVKIASKEAANWSNYNVKPIYYYWSFYTQSGVWTIPAFVALLYPYLKNRVSNQNAYRFSLLWTLLSVVLLSLIPEKKARYLLPVLIPMALNTSFYIEYLFRQFADLKLRESWIVYFNFGLIAVIGIAFPVGAYYLLDLEGFYPRYIVTSLALLGCGIAIIYFLWNKNFPRVFYATMMMLCSIMFLGFPLANAFLGNPDFNAFSNLRSETEKQNLGVYEYGSFDPEIVWDFGKPIPVITEDEKTAIPDENRFGLLHYVDTPFPMDQFPGYRVKQAGRYDLNPIPRDRSRYKNRLAREFYILERKN